MLSRLPLYLFFAILLLPPAALALVLPSAPAPEPAPEVQEQRALGAELYTIKCSSCHGATGLGLEEGRLTFPEDHQRCERCHNPLNPPQMRPQDMMEWVAFSIGHPPALRGEESLKNFPNALALHAYTRATMPRHTPGGLTDEEYLSVTAIVLGFHNALPDDVLLTQENLPDFVLRR